MTLDMDALARNVGYDSMRQYIALNYYLPRHFLPISEMAEYLKISSWAIRNWMTKENLPIRERGYPRTHAGFYCEECRVLTSLRYLWYNKRIDKFVCQKCKKQAVETEYFEKDFLKYKRKRRKY